MRVGDRWIRGVKGKMNLQKLWDRWQGLSIPKAFPPKGTDSCWTRSMESACSE